MENKNTETPNNAEQRTIMQNEILAHGGEFDQDRVDTIMAQAGEIAIKQVSSEAENILVNATEGTEAQDSGVVEAEAELSAQDRQWLNEQAAKGNWDQDRVDAVEASLKSR